MTSLLNQQTLAQLTAEFRLSMSRLLRDLCRELRTDYQDVSSRLNLPIGLFEQLGRSLDLARFSTWKVVGWIETLNDLVYFLDLLHQWEKETDRKEFMRQLFAECQDKFFENSYLSDLFPSGGPAVRGFEKRLSSLCTRLAREVTQEALFFDPVRTAKWFGRQMWSGWSTVGSLDANFERADPQAMIPVGLGDGWCEAPGTVRRALRRSPGRSVFLVEAEKIVLRVGRTTFPIWSQEKGKEQWIWRRRAESKVAETIHGSVTIGPTLVYGRDRTPREIRWTDARYVKKIRRAWEMIRAVWPEGHAVLEWLTSRIVPLKAKGVVSFSYRHRPGLSFINCFDRDNLDLIDDLIHENSHHYLNLLLRKYVMYRGDRNQRIFYSPWRRSLRPLRGILHATFTFTMGAILFERLSSWASGHEGEKRWRRAGLTQRDLQRARFRGLEEIESVRYSLQDLRYADRRLGWLTGSGRRLVCQMEEAIAEVEDRLAPHRGEVFRSKFGPALRRHIEQLKKARVTYGPVRVGKI
ncbi:MAG: HEXXH motif-containing putative peptide modification protein [Nitrospira sp.]|nr:HEXXH motif-containing putative peptide modification protein [Nitrospira sp.]MCP9441423.1 HEXXH motif-containing putative peptide modification protein [Nitrospira sp.]